MDLMLPFASDNGARLAAILPSGLAALARGRGLDPHGVLERALGREGVRAPESLPSVRSFVAVVVDGLGHENLRARAAYARTLSRLQQRRIETVIPSTTGAALTTLTTGRLPGEHGLLGYRIRHPEAGLVSTLKDWDDIGDRRAWQRATPLFSSAAELGFRPVAFGRPAHASGGLTEAILRGAEYAGGQRIEDRFAAASRMLRGGDGLFGYLYIDELDKTAHRHGVESGEWAGWLETLDGALADFLRGLPADVGVVVTADHGVVDVPARDQVLLDAVAGGLDAVELIGGEPRMRSLYLREGADAAEVAALWRAQEGGRSTIATRDEAAAAGWFGAIDAPALERIGDVLIAARRRVAYYSSHDDPKSLDMIGQHGGLSETERGVPVALAGALDGTGFASALAKI